MSVHHPTRRHPAPEPAAGEAKPRHGAGGAIVASLAAGAAGALVLALVVFAGGTEATITGALLLGFGFGWALMAVWSVRRTAQPQRWAAVPAAAMTGTGAALVILNPGDETLAVLTWIWPPLLLALAAWTYLQARRTVAGKARWMLTPVFAALVLTSIGATYANVALTREVDYAAPGHLYDVGGHRLHIDCRGHGSPTVVLSNGLGEISASWARITGPVAETTRVCAYDRAGQGWSGNAADPLDGIESAEDLHTLLAEAGERGPYVLVGHSTGGTYALTYAARYPDQVAGMVLLDSSSPEQFTRMPAYPGQYQLMRRGLALMPTFRRVGLAELIPWTSHLPATDAEKVIALTSTTKAASNQRDELSVIRDVFTQAQALTTFDDRPLTVLTASENVGTDGWVGAQEQLAALSVNHVHRTVDSTHAGLLEDAGPAAESVRAIEEVIASVRTGTPLEGQ
ncbi:alpha/beta fold hydrolase [Nocardioides sp. HM23]|uniref:alpha/beta fold hydrolase n=1 Tax=Nocardioides bizhenqiangii TaxID=3095076 RepID=UPI002ACA3FAE|nr:alpha/beta fold hydrolase [Nocardioides sp. HM23]MDZ5623653.1 alpha/beta fold hydrolase [Nocardioides sp. HM23]